MTGPAIDAVVATAAAQVIADVRVAGQHPDLIIALTAVDDVGQRGAASVDHEGVITAAAIDIELRGDVLIDVEGLVAAIALAADGLHTTDGLGAAAIEHFHGFGAIELRADVTDGVGFVVVVRVDVACSTVAHREIQHTSGADVRSIGQAIAFGISGQVDRLRLLNGADVKGLAEGDGEEEEVQGDAGPK